MGVGIENRPLLGAGEKRYCKNHTDHEQYLLWSHYSFLERLRNGKGSVYKYKPEFPASKGGDGWHPFKFPSLDGRG
jgi:hypothetical protein